MSDFYVLSIVVLIVLLWRTLARLAEVQAELTKAKASFNQSLDDFLDDQVRLRAELAEAKELASLYNDSAVEAWQIAQKALADKDRVVAEM